MIGVARIGLVRADSLVTAATPQQQSRRRKHPVAVEGTVLLPLKEYIPTTRSSTNYNNNHGDGTVWLVRKYPVADELQPRKEQPDYR